MAPSGRNVPGTRRCWRGRCGVRRRHSVRRDLGFAGPHHPGPDPRRRWRHAPGVALPLQLRTRALLKHGVKVQGTVVDVEEETSRRSTTYHPVVRFTTADGRTVTFTSGMGFSVRQPRIGSAVPVRYRQDDPEQAEIERAYIWMAPAAPSLLVGVGLLVAAVNVYTDEPQVAPVAEESQVAPPVVDSPDDSVTGEPVPVGPPAKVATGRIGDRLTMVDHSGRAQLQVTVTRLKFSRGDQVLQPE